MTDRLKTFGPWKLLAIAFAAFILLFPVLSDDLYYQNMIWSSRSAGSG